MRGKRDQCPVILAEQACLKYVRQRLIRDSYFPNHALFSFLTWFVGEVVHRDLSHCFETFMLLMGTTLCSL